MNASPERSAPPSSLRIGASTLQGAPSAVEGALVTLGGERYYRIVNHDAMAPFLMSLASDSDHWVFVSSTGALTAGRRDPDHALFPYTTDDRIHDSQDQSGGKTVLRVTRDGAPSLWEPFSSRYQGLYRITRSLAKSVCGNKLLFEETNHDLGLVFASHWMTSERFGLVRRASLTNLGVTPVRVELLDGLQNLLPYGVTRRFQMEYSTLLDGYKESELEPVSGLGLIKLSSIPVDRPEPSEALRVTSVWSEGLPGARRLLCAQQLDRFRRGEPVEEETLIRGRRGAYLLSTALTLAAGAGRSWSIVAELDQDATAVAATLQLLRSGADLRALLDEDVARGTANLTRMVAAADGLQLTGDALSADRHFANALFNIMRGGIPADGYTIDRADFSAFVDRASRAVAVRTGSFRAALPASLAHADFLQRVRRHGDADLERLAQQYLPLTFSRRHGDPSRPWNIFSIEVKGENGERILNYQGNWRDIFQNWEALALSFPGFTESMIAKFLNCSTADGYNPYRVTRDGFDWEVLDPHDAWSFIGYWGDHQVAYLLRLVELSARYHPGALQGLLGRRLFTYANVPYRIRPYAQLLEDPHRTIDFDAALDQRLRERIAAEGTDAAALPGPDGVPYSTHLGEKLLVVLLARFFNYIPEAGLWMNTQRPEWNDANNALVGNGVSMVTLYHLRRLIAFGRELFAGHDGATLEMSTEVAGAFRAVAATLHRHAALLAGPIADRDRKAVLDALGQAGGEYRAALYDRGFSGRQEPLATADLAAFCDVALAHVDHTIRANRRPDGLYHAYNLMHVAGDGIAISRLDEMLEGQAAVLGSGALDAAEALALLDALRASRLYRADQDSYLLNPDKRLPGFLAKNNIPAADLASVPVLADMIARNDRRIVSADVDGTAHFNAAFRNGTLLKDALAVIDLENEDRVRILALYEQVFNHRSFTGRSGTFYKYEGLGCIYWHMVSKLLLAVQEVRNRAALAGVDPVLQRRLAERYAAIRAGIGVHKSPDQYGAIPTDPYSHTPGFAGVQQPGMTGQVKEDLISRLGETAVGVVAGRLVFNAPLVSDEFLARPATFRCVGVDGADRLLDVPAGTMVFTTCQTPVVLHRSGPPQIEVTAADGAVRIVPGLELDVATSQGIFGRDGAVRRLDVRLGL
jgi:hypothetical protein